MGAKTRYAIGKTQLVDREKPQIVSPIEAGTNCPLLMKISWSEPRPRWRLTNTHSMTALPTKASRDWAGFGSLKGDLMKGRGGG